MENNNSNITRIQEELQGQEDRSGGISDQMEQAKQRIAELAKAAAAGDWETAREIQFQLLPLFKAVYGTTSWLGQKYALKTLGVISSAHCRIQPESMLPPARRAEIENYINNNKTFLD